MKRKISLLFFPCYAFPNLLLHVYMCKYVYAHVRTLPYVCMHACVRTYCIVSDRRNYLRYNSTATVASYLDNTLWDMPAVF